MKSRHIRVNVDLDRVRINAEQIRARTQVGLIAVIKADGYGLGAIRAADVLAGVADEFAYFSFEEASAVRRPGLVLGPPDREPREFAELRLRPMISNPRDAQRYADIAVAISVDTGMCRFGCPIEELDPLLRRGNAVDAYTHARGLQSIQQLIEAVSHRGLRRHAAASALLHEPAAWLDAVRPGYALYRDALDVRTSLVSVRDTHGRPAGYTSFSAPRIGIILAGYSHGLAPAPIHINGRPQRILEVGMNSSFVSVDPADRSGDDVILLGEGLDAEAVASSLGVRPHEVLCRYSGFGERTYPAAPRRHFVTGGRPGSRVIEQATGPSDTPIPAGQCAREN